MKYLLLVAFCAVVYSEGIVRTISVGTNEDLAKALEEAMPKKCTKNGKEYDIGQDFENGHLRYKCQKYGVYSIEGCTSMKGKKMNVGDKVVEDNIASQCFKRGTLVAFRSTVCGILGMPDCDKITPDTPIQNTTGQTESHSQTSTIITSQTALDQTKGFPAAPGLPAGWKIVNENGQDVPLANVRVISRTLAFTPKRK